MVGLPEVGDDFGRYRITGSLGRGGMGVVFSAVQRGLDRSVALKVLAPELASEASYRSRFTREATALASLYSPHIIHIYDHGEQDGCLFIATQLVAGGDLWHWLDKNGRMPARQALDVVAQVSSALADAHRAGVVHRDIKPGNVLLHGSGDEEFFAYLCDFGIAKRNMEQSTSTAGVIGTLGYMAPERCDGADASVSTDVYSLGCLLWAALTGSAPYPGTGVQVAIRHMHDPVPTYPGVDPASRSINAVIARSMAKEPENRYPSATAMRLDLLEVIQLLASPSPAEGPGRDDRTVAMPVAPAAEVDTQVPTGPRPETLVAAEHGPPTLTTRGTPHRRPSPRLVVAGLAALACVVLVSWAGVRALTNQTADPQDDGQQATEAVTCWDGERVARKALCSEPRGRAGLRWVFPSLERDFEKCDERVDTTPEPPDATIRSWFCPVSEGSQEGTSYTQWTTTREARASYDSDYAQPSTDLLLEGRPAGRRWRSSGPRADGLFKLSMAYDRWPYSTSVYAGSRAALNRECKDVILRSPRDFGEASPRCR